MLIPKFECDALAYLSWPRPCLMK